ncbi:transposase, partial [[Clostridium] innocuum]|nr:transposase [[Clostridium] innocuum]
IIGKDIVEYLISNLPMNEYSIDDLKELYHLRWTIETSYNRLKNRIKLEEFSGFKEILISSIRIFMQIYGCIT